LVAPGRNGTAPPVRALGVLPLALLETPPSGTAKPIRLDELAPPLAERGVFTAAACTRSLSSWTCSWICCRCSCGTCTGTRWLPRHRQVAGQFASHNSRDMCKIEYYRDHAPTEALHTARSATTAATSLWLAQVYSIIALQQLAVNSWWCRQAVGWLNTRV
jgi:hypothetical protein